MEMLVDDVVRGWASGVYQISEQQAVVVGEVVGYDGCCCCHGRNNVQRKWQYTAAVDACVDAVISGIATCFARRHYGGRRETAARATSRCSSFEWCSELVGTGSLKLS